MYGLGPCFNLKPRIGHMFYSWNLLNLTFVPIILVKDKYYPCSDGDATVFDWVASHR